MDRKELNFLSDLFECTHPNSLTFYNEQSSKKGIFVTFQSLPMLITVKVH